MTIEPEQMTVKLLGVRTRKTTYLCEFCQKNRTDGTLSHKGFICCKECLERNQMKDMETLLNRLLESFEYLLSDDIVFEIVVDETLWASLVGGNMADAIIKEPKNSHWKRGDNLIPICTLDYVAAGRKPTIMLKSKKGVILSWPISSE